MTIQAVFFDMGGTIENFWYTRELRLEATPEIRERLLSVGIDLCLTNEQLYELVSSGLDRYHKWRFECQDELPAEKIWREYILPGSLDNPSSIDEIAEDLMVYIETHYYHREMRPEIPVVLEAIRAMGLKIGLISNVCSRGQVPFSLNQYGISQFFDPVVLSSEYGRRKPDPAIFHYAARLARAPTSECVHVGDRINRDIAGARKAGYRLAIQIRHKYQRRDEEDEGAQPDAVIDNMTELIDILKAELAKRPGPVSSGKEEFPPVRALFFDAGDILYFRPRRGRKLRAFLQELRLGDINSHLEEKQSLTNQAYLGWIDREQYLENILRMYGVKQLEDLAQGKKILDEEDNNIEFIPGVRNTLLALKDQGFLLGIITDTALPVSQKLKWFEQGGFGKVWDSIVSSRELGIRKPNPLIYCAALQQLGVSANQAAFVGHKAYELEGARAIGMKTIAFNYEDTAEADFYIDTFQDLLIVPIVAAHIDIGMNTHHG